jgi:CRP/FNR family transcriptional regulator, anaerobic regulatory protein
MIDIRCYFIFSFYLYDHLIFMANIIQDLSVYFPMFEKDLLKEIMAVAEVKTVKEGETIMRSGQNIRSSILVVDGLIKIYREDEEGNEFFMYYLDGGKACALSLVCGVKQETSELMAKAVTESTLVSIPLKAVDQWMGKYKSWNEFALNSYRQRFEELLQTIDHIAFRNMDERLIFYLKRHRVKTGSEIISNTFTEIAQDLNSSREVISRLMKKLSEKGYVRLHRSHVELLNLDLFV